MRSLPDSFADRLRREFRSRFRVRWSSQRGCFVVEQRETHPEELHPLEMEKLDPMDDVVVRAREGFSLLFEVWPGTLVPCRHCGADLKLPQPKKLCKLDCAACALRGKNETSTFAASYDLNEQLLETLRDIDYVDHSGLAPQERLKRMREKNLWLQETRKRHLHQEQRYSVDHDWRAIASVPRTGYRQDTKYWINPAISKPFIKEVR